MRSGAHLAPSLALVLALVAGTARAEETRPLPRPDRAPPSQPAATPGDASPAPFAPEGAPDDAACRATLAAVGAVFDPLPPIVETGQPGCGIARPVRLREAPGGLAIEGGAVMRCDTALAVVRWLRDGVRPVTALLDGGPRLTAVRPGSTYQCRVRRGDSGPVKLSEHATGGAFDLMGLRFADRAELTVEGAAAGREALVLRLMRRAACARFATVLGPGSNAAHADHLHVDLAARRGGHRICE